MSIGTTITNWILAPIAGKSPGLENAVRFGLGTSLPDENGQEESDVGDLVSGHQDIEDDWATIIIVATLLLFLVTTHIDLRIGQFLVPFGKGDISLSNLIDWLAPPAAMIFVTLVSLILAARLPWVALILSSFSIIVAGQLFFAFGITGVIAVVIPMTLLWWFAFESENRRWLIIAFAAATISILAVTGGYASTINFLHARPLSAILGYGIVLMVVIPPILALLCRQFAVSASSQIRPETVAAYTVGILALGLWLLWLDVLLRRIWKRKNATNK